MPGDKDYNPNPSDNPEIIRAAINRRNLLISAGIGMTSVSGFAQASAGQSTSGGDKVWSFETNGAVSSSPTVVDGTVYFGSNDGRLYAVDVSTGDKQWVFKHRNSNYTTAIISSPNVVDGKVFIASRDRYLYAVDAATGEQQWAFETDHSSHSSPTVVDGTVFVASGRNVYAVDATTGDQQWIFETDSLFYANSPVVVNDTIFIGNQDNKLYAIDRATGDQKWSFKTGDEIRASPTVIEGNVFIGSADDSFYTLDAGTGDLQWDRRIRKVTKTPTVSDGTVLTGGSVFLIAMDSVTGDQKWSINDFGSVSISSSPTMVGETIFTGKNNNLIAVDATTGEQQWMFETGDEVWSSPTVVDGTVFVGSNDNKLYAIDAGVNDSSDDSRIRLGTLGHHNTFANSSSSSESPTNPAPTATFKISPTNPNTGENITFDASESSDNGNIVAYEWDMDDNGAFDTTGQTVTKVFESPGDYDITLRVTDDQGKSDTTSQTVPITDTNTPPTASFEISPMNPEAGEDITFDASESSDDSNIVAYEWDMDDNGAFDTTGQTVTKVFESPGDYDITLRVTDGQQATNTTSRIVSISSSVELSPSISVSSTETKSGETVTFDASDSTGNINSYNWEFGDGETNNGITTSHSYEEPDTYTVNLTIDGEDGSTATTSINITVTDPLQFSIYPDTPIVGQPITFEASGGDNYEWDLGDGTTVNGQQITHSYETDATYTITLVSSSDTVSRDIQVEPIPITITDISREFGGVPLQSISYKDTFRATIDSDNQIETVDFQLGDESKTKRNFQNTPEATFDLGSLDGSTILIVTATDTEGYEATSQQTVTISPVPEWMEWLVESAEIAVDESGKQIDITHNPLDLSGYSFSLGEIPIDTDPPGFDSANAGAEVSYDTTQQAAVLEGDGGVETELFGYSFEAELGVEGAIDSDLDLVDASAIIFASISGQIGPPLYVNIPPGVPCLDDQLGIETTIAPGIELEADFDGEFKLEKGIVTPETELTVGTEIDICGIGAGAEVSGELDASFDVGTSSRNLTGTISAEGDVWFSVSVIEREFDAGFEVVLPAGSTQMVANQAQSRTEPGWSVADKRGVQPAIGVSSVDATSITTSTTSPLAPTTDESNSFQRLTDRPLEDTQPAMTTVGSETLVLWSSQRESASATAGRDIAYRSTDGTEWSEVEYLTIESRSHEAPAVAASNGSALAVWEHVTTDITENTDPADIHPHIEIAYAIYDGETWSEATVLTDTISREFQPTVAPSDNGWVIGWEQATAPEADAGQRNVRYTEITTDDTVGTIETIAEAAYPDTGAYADSGAVLGYASLNDGEPTAAVTTRIIGGSQTDSQRFSATAIRSLTVGSDRLIWQEGSVSDPTLVEANRGTSGTEELSVRDAVDAIAEPTLSTDGEQAVLSYRAYVETAETRELVYRLNRGSGWIFDRQFVQAPDSSQTVWQPETTFVSGADQFETVFAISETSQSAKNDIFLTEHDFRPAYAIAADGPSGATAGETVTLEYDLRNRGDIDGTQGVTVTVLNAAGTQATKRYPGLAAGETVSDSVVVAVDETGEFKLEITTGEQNLSTVAATSDNFDADSTTVTVATPQLSVEEITTEGSETVGITVSNTGGATAFDVPLRVTDGEAELTSTTINELGYGETSTTTASIDPRSIDRSSEDTVELDPDRTLPEAVSESDRVTPTWLLQSDLRVTEEISYRRGTVAQIVADVVVGNSNPVAGTGTLQAKTTDGSVVGETSISIAGTESGTNYTTVSLGLDTIVSEDDTLRFAIDPAVPDADPTTLSQQTTVESVSETDESGAKVNLLNTTLSDGPVDSTPSSHTLQFTAENVSADNRADSFSIELPEKIDVEEEDIKNVTVRNGEYNVTPSVENNTINFDVNPGTDDTSLVDLDIEVDMTLSTNDS